MHAAEAPEKHLLLSNDQYRQLATRHQELDTRLHELSAKHYLSVTEELDEVTLKKRKLALKDQMEEMARQFQTGGS